MAGSPPQRRSIPFNLNTPSPSPNKTALPSSAVSVSDVILQGERDLSSFSSLRELELVKAQLRKANESLDRADKARTALVEKLEVALAERNSVSARLDSRESEMSRIIHERDARVTELESLERELRAQLLISSSKQAELATEAAASRQSLVQAEADLKEAKARIRELETRISEAAEVEEARVAQLEAEKRSIIDQAEAKTLALIEALRQVQLESDELRETEARRRPPLAARLQVSPDYSRAYHDDDYYFANDNRHDRDNYNSKRPPQDVDEWSPSRASPQVSTQPHASAQEHRDDMGGNHYHRREPFRRPFDDDSVGARQPQEQASLARKHVPIVGEGNGREASREDPATTSRDPNWWASRLTSGRPSPAVVLQVPEAAAAPSRWENVRYTPTPTPTPVVEAPLLPDDWDRLNRSTGPPGFPRTTPAIPPSGSASSSFQSAYSVAGVGGGGINDEVTAARRKLQRAKRLLEW